ncbi:MAG: 50S ribosomal protein L18e [Candidatus Aenigmatarchaeota archaeon]|nr:50S ribosomal protein L18e [Nanoarchaeota archaeon]
MKLRDKNHILRDLMEEMMKKGLEEPLWKGVAKGINKPRRGRHEINLGDIEKHAKAKETLVVPGVVLGSGNITKPVTIAALKFSDQAQKMIEKVGGKCMSIQDLMDSKPKHVRILG